MKVIKTISRDEKKRLIWIVVHEDYRQNILFESWSLCECKAFIDLYIDDRFLI